MVTFPTILSCDWSTYPQRITTGPILSYTPSLCTRPRPRRRIREPIRSPLTRPLAKYTCIPSLSMMFGKKSPSAHTQPIQYSLPSTIFFTRHQNPPPVAIAPRATSQVPVWMLFDCWRLLNNESIPIPRKIAKEYSRMFPLFLTFSSISTTIAGPLFPVVESFQTRILSPSLFYKTIHSHFQMAPICNAHSTSLGCSSIPFIVHLIDLNHLHKSSLLFRTLTQHPSHTFNHFHFNNTTYNTTSNEYPPHTILLSRSTLSVIFSADSTTPLSRPDIFRVDEFSLMILLRTRCFNTHRFHSLFIVLS